MYKKVLAVFTDTDFSEPLYRRALEAARENGAVLCLASVRTEGRADRLAHILCEHSLLGRRMEEEIGHTLRRVRSQGVERSLAAMGKKARLSGVEAEWCSIEGAYLPSVQFIAEQREADAVVVPKGAALELVGLDAAILTV